MRSRTLVADPVADSEGVLAPSRGRSVPSASIITRGRTLVADPVADSEGVLAPGRGRSVPSASIITRGRTPILSDLTPPPPHGDTLSAATNIGTLSTYTTTGAIDLIGDQDYFRFSLSNTSNLSVSLTGLSADADLEIIRDGNFNSTVEAGEVLKSSRWGGSTSESISLQGLGSGSYYVRVHPYGNAVTNYSLNLTASAGSGYATEANNTLATAYNIGGPGYSSSGNLNGNRTFTGWVGDSDTQDFYRFSLGASSNVSLALTGLGADAELQLIRDSNFNGTIDAGELLGGGYSSGSASESINFTGLAAGDYNVRVYRYSSANTSYTLNMGTPSSFFSSFNTYDASSDNTYNTVFEGGALRFNYSLATGVGASSVGLQAISSTGAVTSLGSWAGSSTYNAVVNLASYPGLATGSYTLRAVAYGSGGNAVYSSSSSLNVLAWGRSTGSFTADTFNYSAGVGTGTVIQGRGGTDTLNLGIGQSQVTGINGLSLTSFNPSTNSTWSQATFRGTAFDYVTLTDGREIYMQGIENLRFNDGSTLELQVHPDDTFYNQQWNLNVSDVSSAWRFTRGSSNVLLASLDSGILTAAGASGGITDLTTSRLITDATDDDNYANYGHGHSAISVMSSTANNRSGVAGINWNSNVYVNDVYSGVTLRQAIIDTLAYAREHNQRVVFQGGIQGEGWLTNGGTQAQLEQLIRDNSDIAFFAIAAGNGGPGGNLSDSNYMTSVSGVAKLQTNHTNVMSVGALQRTGTATVNGLTNASTVGLASYSNRGSNLTLVAATDSPAMDKLGNMRLFGGTSAANPNMAGIASLVWSANSSLTGGQVRQILIDTSMDLGTPGADNTYGRGLVNADAAVRRAWALRNNSDVASLHSGSSLV
ncbi:MAG: S8 family serine peptidase [Stenomitos frigidus ULC029]